MNTPDLNLLPVFEALLRHGNVTRVAAHMGLTQSAMSSALGRLRRQLGARAAIETGLVPHDASRRVTIDARPAS